MTRDLLLKLGLIVPVVAVGIALGIYKAKQDTKDDPEMACREASAGDPTCLSPAQLSDWCETQENQKALPQCNLSKTAH